MSAIHYPVSFNSQDLQSINKYINVYSVDYDAMERNLNIFTLARRSARKLASAFYQARKIYISIYISAPNRDQADIAIDQLLQYIQGQEGTLVIPQSGSTRQYTATYSKMSKNNSGVGKANVTPPKGGFDDFTLVFECSDSYGYDQGYTLITNQTSLTSNSVSVSYTQGGSAEEQAPFIQVYYIATTGASSGTLRVGNSATGQEVVITRDWVTGDVLQIDARYNTVQVNGVDVNFTGAIPTFGLGSQKFYVNDNFTTRTYDLFAYVYNRYV